MHAGGAQIEQLGPYRLLEQLGHGGMAVVYRAERIAEAGFRKQFAIKRMLPHYRRSPALLERFAAEARTTARLDHPNVVHVLDFGIEPEPYLVMEFVEGVSLAGLLQRMVQKGAKLELAAACFVAAEAAMGLDYAHRKKDERGHPLGIVHRDVSPQNVLLSNEGAVKVSDFGLVKVADSLVNTQSGVPLGKISYMAPEQADGRPLDARADVFSLGVVLWEMLTLRTLIPHEDPQRAAEILRDCVFHPPSAYNREVPQRLDEVVMGCLLKDPAARTPSAQAISLMLRELLHELSPGYGREQLARLLAWAFPERGWQVEEPHLPAAQPDAAARASMPPTPSAVHAVTARHAALVSSEMPVNPGQQLMGTAQTSPASFDEAPGAGGYISQDHETFPGEGIASREHALPSLEAHAPGLPASPQGAPYAPMSGPPGAQTQPQPGPPLPIGQSPPQGSQGPQGAQGGAPQPATSSTLPLAFMVIGAAIFAILSLGLLAFVALSDRGDGAGREEAPAQLAPGQAPPPPAPSP